MQSKILSISIPTFNRSEILKKNILLMIEDLKPFSIPIYISDDSDDDKTKIIVCEMKKIYKYIYYTKNLKRLGHDKNIFHTISLPKSDYVWLLGDSLFFKKNSLKYIFGIIKKHRPDLISVNSELRNLDLKSRIYKNCNKVLNDLGWHLTWTGATIYSQKVISNVHKLDINKSVNFPQISIIFNHLANSCSFYWLNYNILDATKKNKSYWSKFVFKIFFEDFNSALLNLPNCYGKEIKEKVFLDHSKKTKLFNFKSLLFMRSVGIYNFNSFRKYSKFLFKHSDESYLILILILIIPRRLLRLFIK